MGRLDEPLKTFGPAVGGMRCVDVYAVVAPPMLAGEGGDGHDLDRGDAELPQVVQARDDSLERALRRERPHVELIDDEVLEAEAVPPFRLRGDRADDLRRTAKTLRLGARDRVGEAFLAVQNEFVPRAGSCL